MAQRLRLATGLILFTYVATHLLNHATGVSSLVTAEVARLRFVAFWRHPVATAALYGSLVTHFVLVLASLYRRRHLRMSAGEAARIALGLVIPFALIPHIIGTRVQHAAFRVDDTYTQLILTYVFVDPQAGLRQLLLLIVAWTHGCMGIHYWLRFRPWYPKAAPLLLVSAVLVPVLALAGVIAMGAGLAETAADPLRIADAMDVPSPSTAATLIRWRNLTLAIVGTVIAGVFAARHARTLVARRRRGTVRITYPSGRQISVTAGTTVLEASHMAGIPHASLCGGRGRCSTCRTRIAGEANRLPPPAPSESRILARIAAPPNVRLACQLRPHTDLDVFPLLPASVRTIDVLRSTFAGIGREQPIAVLFADLRAFTRLAENRLPFDVLFILDQYFEAMGRAIERSGGYVDKFLGDGVMALFGLDTDIAAGCRQALSAAVAMVRSLEELNGVLSHDLAEPLRMGVGIHAGPVFVGELGYGRARRTTAVGNPVNVASRLEALTKEYASQIVLSEDVASLAGIELNFCEVRQTDVRGVTTTMRVRLVTDVAPLEAALAAAGPATAVARSRAGAADPSRGG